MNFFNLTKDNRKQDAKSNKREQKADKLLYAYERIMWQVESHIDNADQKLFTDNEQELLNTYLELIHTSEITLRKMRKLVK